VSLPARKKVLISVGRPGLAGPGCGHEDTVTFTKGRRAGATTSPPCPGETGDQNSGFSFARSGTPGQVIQETGCRGPQEGFDWVVVAVGGKPQGMEGLVFDRSDLTWDVLSGKKRENWWRSSGGQVGLGAATFPAGRKEAVWRC
jgi:hypothetical protein